MMTWFVAFGCIGIGIKLLLDDKHRGENDD